MNQDLSKTIKLIVKSEKALFKLEIRKKSKQFIWAAIGIIAIFISLVMLNITLYFYLSSNLSSLVSTSILTIMNFIFTAMAFYIASGSHKSTEVKSIEEIRDYAWTQIANDIDETKNSIEEFKDSILKAKESIFGFKSLLPILTSIIDYSKKGKNDAN